MQKVLIISGRSQLLSILSPGTTVVYAKISTVKSVRKKGHLSVYRVFNSVPPPRKMKGGRTKSKKDSIMIDQKGRSCMSDL